MTFIHLNTKRRDHLSDSGIGTRIVLRYKEIGHGVCMNWIQLSQPKLL